MCQIKPFSGDGDDQLFGLGGDDYLEGDAGIDISIITDTFSANSGSEAILITSADGTDEINSIEILEYSDDSTQNHKDIWSLLNSSDQASFDNNSSEFDMNRSKFAGGCLV